VWPLLEYSSIIWSPYTNGMNKIEAVQRFLTKAIGNLRSFKHSEQLQYLNLDSLNLFKLTKMPIAPDRDENYFSNSVINIRNSLPDNIVAARSIASFKRSINDFDFSHFFL